MIFSKFFHLASLMLISSTGFAEPKVVVVGAGIAGLTTAYRLQQKGMDVHVYDARNRVGGRIFSAKIGDTVAELGGQNINDGGKAENIHRLIEEFELDLSEIKDDLNLYYLNEGELIADRLLGAEEFHVENLEERLAEAAQNSENMRDVFDKIFKSESPLYKSYSVRMAAYEGAPIEKLSPLYKETLFYMLQGGLCSVHPGSKAEEKTIDLVTIKGGNALLPAKLAKELKVHLNMPLIEVSKNIQGSYELLFQNGQKTQADILVLAIPCSVYNDISFEEGIIPEKRLESIRNVQYGTNAKILLSFPQRPPERLTLMNNQTVCFFNGDRSILTLYYTGDTGQFSEDTILETYQKDRPMIELGFGEFCPPFLKPTLARDEFLASYEGPVGHSWPNDPYVKGSYSYIAQGQEALLTDLQNEGEELVKTLFAPIDQTLYFAGEHASILMNIPGTMEAACESGERTARMIQMLRK